MLDHISVFSDTGLVLWSKTFCKVEGAPVENFIDTVLMEEKGGEKQTIIDKYSVKWSFANGAGFELVFVAIYSKLLTLLYIEDLLEAMKAAFLSKFESRLAKPNGEAYPFDAEFNRLLDSAETKSMQQKKNKYSGKAVTGITQRSPMSGSDDKNSKADSQPSLTPTGKGQAAGDGEDFIGDGGVDVAAARAKLQSKYSKDSGSKKQVMNTPSPQPGRKGKEDRVWSGGGGKISSKQAKALDRSNTNGDSQEDVDQFARDTYLPSDGEKPQWVVEEEEAREIEAAVEAPASGSAGWNFGNTYLGSLVQTVTGGKILTKEDLKPVMEKIMESLQGKNVAQEIADDICSSVTARLEGQAMESFTSIHSVATVALKEAVQRVLTPRTSTDVLRQVMDAKAEGRVYSIVFVGINGVGKSTSLAKVGYFLKEHGLKVLIAACDTFRSGAVEQLKTHSRCLDAPLFDMGYAKDPSKVASAALSHAKNNDYDVVLIDTAGRMQNNEKLMRALATLIGENDPSLVLFVGEALVGNDGIDQLTMFDQALVTYSPPGRAHRIDGIILTKFDTIDDKVGAALSMSYKSGQPIMFVGTGQKYTHLKRLNVNTVVKHLFSPPSL